MPSPPRQVVPTVKEKMSAYGMYSVSALGVAEKAVEEGKFAIPKKEEVCCVPPLPLRVLFRCTLSMHSSMHSSSLRPDPANSDCCTEQPWNALPVGAQAVKSYIAQVVKVALCASPLHFHTPNSASSDLEGAPHHPPR